MLWSHAYIIVLLIVCKYMYIRQQTYDCDCTTQETTNYTTNDAFILQVETNYDFWSASQYVNPFVKLL